MGSQAAETIQRNAMVNSLATTTVK